MLLNFPKYPSFGCVLLCYGLTLIAGEWLRIAGVEWLLSRKKNTIKIRKFQSEAYYKKLLGLHTHRNCKHRCAARRCRSQCCRNLAACDTTSGRCDCWCRTVWHLGAAAAAGSGAGGYRQTVGAARKKKHTHRQKKRLGKICWAK